MTHEHGLIRFYVFFFCCCCYSMCIIWFGVSALCTTRNVCDVYVGTPKTKGEFGLFFHFFLNENQILYVKFSKNTIHILIFFGVLRQCVALLYKFILMILLFGGIEMKFICFFFAPFKSYTCGYSSLCIFIYVGRGDIVFLVRLFEWWATFVSLYFSFQI